MLWSCVLLYRVQISARLPRGRMGPVAAVEKAAPTEWFSILSLDILRVVCAVFGASVLFRPRVFRTSSDDNYPPYAEGPAGLAIGMARNRRFFPPPETAVAVSKFTSNLLRYLFIRLDASETVGFFGVCCSSGIEALWILLPPNQNETQVVGNETGPGG